MSIGKTVQHSRPGKCEFVRRQQVNSSAGLNFIYHCFFHLRPFSCVRGSRSPLSISKSRC